SHWAVFESRDQLRKEYGVETDYLRLRAFPFTRAVLEFIQNHERVYVIDQNRDGQLNALLTLDLPVEQIGKLRSVRHYNGLPLDARSVTDDIISREGFGAPASPAAPTANIPRRY